MLGVFLTICTSSGTNFQEYWVTSVFTYLNGKTIRQINDHMNKWLLNCPWTHYVVPKPAILKKSKISTHQQGYNPYQNQNTLFFPWLNFGSQTPYAKENKRIASWLTLKFNEVIFLNWLTFFPTDLTLLYVFKGFNMWLDVTYTQWLLGSGNLNLPYD